MSEFTVECSVCGDLLDYDFMVITHAFDNVPLAILIEPKAGTYRIQTSVEYEGKLI